MKKVFSCFVLGVGLVTLVACNNANEPENKPDDSKSKVEYVTYEAKYTDGDLIGDYNLCESIQDGAILHCWNWSYNTIKANLAQIASSGYSAIQTSPVQQSKSNKKSGAWTSEWSKLYQPVSFSVAADSYLGTKEELVSLCTEAKKYGIKVIVDVVLNHMGNDNSGTEGSYAEAIETYSPDVWANKEEYFHQDTGNSIDYNNAYQITHRRLSNLPDLNTANTDVQNWALGLLTELLDCGVSGFRFDAAKHIETDLDAADTKSDFWKNVLSGATKYAQDHELAVPYYYGEVLDNPGGGRPFTNYTQYMSVTDTFYSDQLLSASTVIPQALTKNINGFKASTNGLKSVVWAESHDTFANTDGKTKNVDQARINRAYAIAVSHSGSAALYFARPNDTTPMGEVGTLSWKNDAISAINLFHNKHLKEKETVSVQGTFYLSERTNGAVIIGCYGSKDVSIYANGLADGKYYDQVTGNEFNVQNGLITGTVGEEYICVLEKTQPVLSPTITPTASQGYFYTSYALTLNVANAESAKYKINDGEETSFTNTTNITLTDTSKVTVTVKNGSKIVEETYTFTKIEKKAGYVAMGGLKVTDGKYVAWAWPEGTGGKWVEVLVEGDIAYIPTTGVDNYLLVIFPTTYDLAPLYGTSNNVWSDSLAQTSDYPMEEDVVQLSII
ncbi:MAG: hypothetical protein K6B64_01560 [Acholeplasmatales bacterium]|nr:hypothetical protein [Acholeplasmatales bacterium]